MTQVASLPDELERKCATILALKPAQAIYTWIPIPVVHMAYSDKPRVERKADPCSREDRGILRTICAPQWSSLILKPRTHKTPSTASFSTFTNKADFSKSIDQLLWDRQPHSYLTMSDNPLLVQVIKSCSNHPWSNSL